MTRLEQLQSAASVVLVGQRTQLSFIDLEQFAEVVVRDFASVRAVGIAPRLTTQIGSWPTADHIDMEEFVARLSSAEKSSALIERLVQGFLLPWLAPVPPSALPRRATAPTPSVPMIPDVVQRTIRIQEALLNEVQCVDADGWARWRRAPDSKNPSAALGKYKQAGRLFAVRSGRRDLYPIFQFSQENGEPLQGMAVILSRVPEKARGWPLLSWFNAKNTLLDGRKPLELIATEPDRVAAAAARFYSHEDD